MTTPLCEATKTDGSGDTCKHQAGWGTDHPGYGPCRKHGGNTRNHRAAATKAQAADTVEAMSIPVDTSPEDALVAEVKHVAGDVRFLRDQVHALGGDLTQHVATQGGGGYDAPSVWIDLYWQAHDRLVKVCAATIKAGIAERQVRLAEQHGELVAQAIRAMLDDLGVEITPEVQGVVRRHLEAVA